MIRLSVLYPATDGADFDHDYYRDHHVPMVSKEWGLEGAEIDRGVQGPYVAAVHLRFPSMEAFQDAMASEATQKILADLPNYTTITPVMQVSEIVS